ncbi:MAG: hypothetical protein M3355_11875 [Actinomycetota bacterium]|nr:hypothetical protein [Actinomycetota bacterium]
MSFLKHRQQPDVQPELAYLRGMRAKLAKQPRPTDPCGIQGWEQAGRLVMVECLRSYRHGAEPSSRGDMAAQ